MKLLVTYLPLIVIVLAFWFILLRPQQKRQKERQNLLRALGTGDQIVTIGGLHGTIVELSDTSVTLRVNDDCNVVFDRSAISSVRNKATV